MHSILIVDDEPHIMEILEIVLQEEGMEVSKASSVNEALPLVRERDFDMVISDIRMPDRSGVELLKECRQIRPETIFIMITAYATTDTAIEALQHGAYDYITKPFKMGELRHIVRQALEKKKLRREVAVLKSEIETQQGRSLFQALHRSRIIGRSPRMLEVYRTIATVASGDSTVLITGESGTGKELVARAIHGASPRRDRPFVSINCGAFPETLLESELFGYMKGAFTGAVGNKKGLFEAAEGGSIFLDEIGEMTTAMQVKILRVLQERRLRPLGGTAEVPVDVRVIAATNRDPAEGIRQGQFREDLYYRIAVITIHVPPLRERSEDIDPLAFHFLRQFAEKSGKKVFGISREAMACLQSYPWPGNVRELENTIERAIALETSDSIQIERLPAAMRHPFPAASAEAIPVPDGPFDLESLLSEIERSLLCQALEKCGGNQTLAAQRLNLTRPSLRHKLQTLGIDPARFRKRTSA